MGQLRSGFVTRVALAAMILSVASSGAMETEIRQAALFIPNWHGNGRAFRVAMQVSADGFARTDKAVETSLNLPLLLTQAGGSGVVALSSLRLVEVNAIGDLLDSNIPFQFDGFNVGTLVWIMKGSTGSGTTRHYQLYFDTVAFAAASFGDQVNVTDGVMDEGQSSFRIITSTGTYFFQKEAAGISSLLDTLGNDWISYSTAPGSAGEFRGIPNLLFPANIYHPGFTSASTTLTQDGPVKATFESPSDNGLFRTRWEFYPDHATLTVLQATGTYWFLYEGTPGGTLDRVGPNNDFLVRSDGTLYSVADSWGAGGQDIPGDEWVYFADPIVGKSLFLIQHTNDDATDWYQPLDSPADGPDSDWMTVFGFGRGPSTSSLLTQVPRKFTIGLVGTTTFTTAQSAINSAYKDLTVSVGEGESGTCGDGLIDVGEECDDGNKDPGDGCDSNCILEACSNGITQFGEECDDGNVDDLDGCGNDCTLNFCSDAELNNGEQCDDGGTVGGDGCDENCLFEICGNAIPQAGEECDDGNLDELDACASDCTANFCGDGEVNNGEECDDGNATDNDGCRNDCRVPRCGDGWVDVGEQCDDGNIDDLDSCGNDCVVNFCGDAETNYGEQCDDGNTVDNDLCNNACMLTTACESAVINPGFDDGTAPWKYFRDGTGTFKIVDGEADIRIGTPGTNVQLYQFDIAIKGATVYRLRFRGRNTVGSDVSLRLQKHETPFTVYGLSAIIDLGTEMEEHIVIFTTPSGDRTDGRLTLQMGAFDVANTDYFFDDILLQRLDDCPYCGDAVVGIGEFCDDGNLDNEDGCRNDCKSPSCGDGFLDAGEECDDGNLVAGDGCDASCAAENCGNGVVQSGEQCDDGNAALGDGCDADCVLEVCGNGVPQAGEECDDGGTAAGDGCDADCTFEICGNGVLQSGEECDDGNLVDGDGCRTDCTIPFCGDLLVDTLEECDDGNTDDLDLCGNDCILNFCGDSQTNNGEECDDGNGVDTDGCLNNCTWNPCGAVDIDGDNLNDICDPDDDNDGVEDALDCDPLDPLVWEAPGVVTGLTIVESNITLLFWTSAGDGFSYDVVAGDLADLAADGGVSGATCVVGSTGNPFTGDSAMQVLPGEVRYYIVRSRNSCGVGSFGTGPGGAERQPLDSCD